jgi:hypothetical protein
VALEHEDLETRESARSAIRGFIDRIVIPPGDELLQVVGNLGEMLTAAGAAVGKGGCGGAQPAEFGVRLGGGLAVNNHVLCKRARSCRVGPATGAETRRHDRDARHCRSRRYSCR